MDELGDIDVHNFRMNITSGKRACVNSRLVARLYLEISEKIR